MSKPNVYILGGYQTDFARNWSRDGASIYDILKATVEGALAATDIESRQVQVAHIGNFVGELFCGQGHLGGMFASIDPAFAGIPASRHEAACASGSTALLAAMSELEAGRYDLACVAGVEQMRNVSSQEAAEHLGAAAWVGREAQDAQFPWPYLFSRLCQVYDERYGVKPEHLARIAQINFSNARRNPNAQARDWNFDEKDFTADDERNPVIEGRIRKQDCGRITDGGAAVFLASEQFAKEYAKRREINLENIPIIKGWGHHTAPMLFDAKIALSQSQPYVFPHVRATIQDAFRRAEMSDVHEVDCIETHDCFTITEYMAIDHFGITPPGESWRALDNGDIELEGRIPMNPSGGLIGDGHPVGATGIRMLLDAYKQVTNRAGDYQIENAHNVATLNIGGSATTVVSFIVGKHS